MDNGDGSLSYDSVSEKQAQGNELREKQFITTARGKEQRLLLLMKERSPLVQRTAVPGKDVSEWPVKKLDLVMAASIFPIGSRFYIVTAGVSTGLARPLSLLAA
jgi:hypothetical protein